MISKEPDVLFTKLSQRFGLISQQTKQVNWLIKSLRANVSTLDVNNIQDSLQVIAESIGKTAWKKSHLIFKGVVILVLHEHNQHLHISNIPDLIAKFPEFTHFYVAEQIHLLSFYNYLVSAVTAMDTEQPFELFLLIDKLCGIEPSASQTLQHREPRARILSRILGTIGAFQTEELFVKYIVDKVMTGKVASYSLPTLASFEQSKKRSRTERAVNVRMNPTSATNGGAEVRRVEPMLTGSHEASLSTPRPSLKSSLAPATTLCTVLPSHVPQHNLVPTHYHVSPTHQNVTRMNASGSKSAPLNPPSKKEEKVSVLRKRASDHSVNGAASSVTSSDSDSCYSLSTAHDALKSSSADVKSSVALAPNVNTTNVYNTLPPNTAHTTNTHNITHNITHLNINNTYPAHLPNQQPIHYPTLNTTYLTTSLSNPYSNITHGIHNTNQNLLPQFSLMNTIILEHLGLSANLYGASLTHQSPMIQASPPQLQPNAYHMHSQPPIYPTLTAPHYSTLLSNASSGYATYPTDLYTNALYYTSVPSTTNSMSLYNVQFQQPPTLYKPLTTHTTPTTHTAHTV